MKKKIKYFHLFTGARYFVFIKRDPVSSTAVFSSY